MKLILQIAFGVALGLCLIPIGCVVCTTSTIVGGGAAIVAAAEAQREAAEAKERNKPQEQKDQGAKAQLLKEQEILNPRGKKDDEEKKDREAKAKELREAMEKDLKDKQVKKGAALKVYAAKEMEWKEKAAALAALDKSYRDAAKKALAAEKADQFEAAKKFKDESLKGYADWKKEKAKVDSAEFNLKKLKRELEDQ